MILSEYYISQKLQRDATELIARRTKLLCKYENTDSPDIRLVILNTITDIEDELTEILGDIFDTETSANRECTQSKLQCTKHTIKSALKHHPNSPESIPAYEPDE